jgi:hypothetical protein
MASPAERRVAIERLAELIEASPSSWSLSWHNTFCAAVARFERGGEPLCRLGEFRAMRFVERRARRKRPPSHVRPH